MKYELPKLPYAYDALEPWIDAKTMEIHLTKHHQTYVNKLNDALAQAPEIADKPLEELLRTIEEVPESIRTAIRNHGGGHSNHSLFWTIMGPAVGGAKGGAAMPAPDEKSKISNVIVEAFGGFPKFQSEFSKAAAGIFGSGWAWLVKDEHGKLSITTTPNQDSPLMHQQKPVLGLDVWEHAYYILHTSDRKAYIENWWNVVNWKAVEGNL